MDDLDAKVRKLVAAVDLLAVAVAECAHSCGPWVRDQVLDAQRLLSELVAPSLEQRVMAALQANGYATPLDACRAAFGAGQVWPRDALTIELPIPLKAPLVTIKWPDDPAPIELTVIFRRELGIRNGRLTYRIEGQVSGVPGWYIVGYQPE